MTAYVVRSNANPLVSFHELKSFCCSAHMKTGAPEAEIVTVVWQLRL